jgi:hypothetical protein
MSIENDSSPTARAERARYLGAIPGALWERMTRPERQVFTGGTVTEVRALAARLGIKPESRRTAARTKAPTDPVTATACSIARTGDMGALTRFLNAAKPTTREVPPVADAPKVEDMDPAVARAFGFLPAYEHQSEAVHYPAAGHAERVANRGA